VASSCSFTAFCPSVTAACIPTAFPATVAPTPVAAFAAPAQLTVGGHT
jgi:hypothetical protein